MGKIVAFSGKKQAGKNTAANFLFGLEMWSILDPESKEPLISTFRIDDKGRLIIPVDFGPDKGGVRDGIFDPTSRSPFVQTFLNAHVWPYVKLYSFADILKELGITLFGLSEEQCYGTNEEKNTYTKLRWSDMPTFNWDTQNKRKLAFNQVKALGFNLSETWSPDDYMTGREFMQYFGTDICRKMYGDIWANATVNRIIREESGIGIITDCRFPNEVKAVKDAGGVVIRLTRSVHSVDEHSSEKALDKDVYDWSNFDAVVDNANMTIQEQNEAIFSELTRLGVINPDRE